MRRNSLAVLLAAGLIAVALLLIAVSLLPRSWWPPAVPAKQAGPLKVEILAPGGAAPPKFPRGSTLGASGYLTILSAPPTPAKPVQHPSLPHPSSPPRGTAIAPALSGRVRLFARLQPVPVSNELIPSDLLPPPQNIGRIVLRDGCFHVDEPNQPHVVFTVGARLFLDDQGYLAVGQGPDSEFRTRIGEMMHWEGKPRPLQDQAMLARVHERCGPGPVQVVGLLQSLSAGQAFADGQSATRLAAMYGLSWDEALARIHACRERLSQGPGGNRIVMVETPCGTTPPPPVSDPARCPPGTTLSAGLCRTPEGSVRPIPPM